MIASDLADSTDTDKLSDDQSEAVSMVTALRSVALLGLPCQNCPACTALLGTKDPAWSTLGKALLCVMCNIMLGTALPGTAPPCLHCPDLLHPALLQIIVACLGAA